MCCQAVWDKMDQGQPHKPIFVLPLHKPCSVSNHLKAGDGDSRGFNLRRAIFCKGQLETKNYGGICLFVYLFKIITPVFKRLMLRIKRAFINILTSLQQSLYFRKANIKLFTILHDFINFSSLATRLSLINKSNRRREGRIILCACDKGKERSDGVQQRMGRRWGGSEGDLSCQVKKIDDTVNPFVFLKAFTCSFSSKHLGCMIFLWHSRDLQRRHWSATATPHTWGQDRISLPTGESLNRDWKAASGAPQLGVH